MTKPWLAMCRSTEEYSLGKYPKPGTKAITGKSPSTSCATPPLRCCLAPTLHNRDRGHPFVFVRVSAALNIWSRAARKMRVKATLKRSVHRVAYGVGDATREIAPQLFEGPCKIGARVAAGLAHAPVLRASVVAVARARRRLRSCVLSFAATRRRLLAPCGSHATRARCRRPRCPPRLLLVARARRPLHPALLVAPAVLVHLCPVVWTTSLSPSCSSQLALVARSFVTLTCLGPSWVAAGAMCRSSSQARVSPKAPQVWVTRCCCTEMAGRWFVARATATCRSLSPAKVMPKSWPGR